MEIPIGHGGFMGRSLLVRTVGLLKGPSLWIDGAPAEGKRLKYVVRDNSGRERAVHLKSNGLDPVPRVAIDGAVMELARPLAWYEYAWTALPIVLVFLGGALGAFIGFMAAFSSFRLFRSELAAPVKYALSLAVSLGAVGAYLAIALLIQGALDP